MFNLIKDLGRRFTVHTKYVKTDAGDTWLFETDVGGVRPPVCNWIFNTIIAHILCYLYNKKNLKEFNLLLYIL